MPTLDPGKLAAWSGGRWTPSAPPAVGGVSNDTRTLRRGDLYVALRGQMFDGHAFVDAAFRAGAAGAVVEAAAALESESRPVLRVVDTRVALTRMAEGYRLAVNPVIVGVTGSAGKTTVKEMMADVLAEDGPTARTRGNWNNEIGLPLSLLAMAGDVQTGVFEIGTNHPGELARLCRVLKPVWGVVTNVGPVHIEFFGSVEAIALEKSALLSQLPQDGVAVLNRDGACFDLLRTASHAPVVTVAMRGDADYVCGWRTDGFGDGYIREAASGEEQEVRLAVPGDHNLMNATFAAAVGRQRGMDWAPIVRALAAHRPLPMRGETQAVGGVCVINDAYNANPLSMRAAIRAFARESRCGGKWLVLGGMLELGADEEAAHVDIGRLVAGEGAWSGLIVVGPLGRLIADGAAAEGFAKERICCCDDNDAAGRALQRLPVPGDAVLLKASRGVALEQAIEGMKEHGEAVNSHGG